MPAYNADIQATPGFPDAAERFRKKLESAVLSFTRSTEALKY